MSEYSKKSGNIMLKYGFDEEVKEYWYEIYDLNFKSKLGGDGLIESGGSKTTGMPTIVLAEKLKQFKVNPEHIKRVLWMKKI